ncbi:MAG: cytochrome C biogenesis protein [Lysobacter sp.]|nr:cytochrome C biogenesis protein [Lysobacter sp.]
MPPFARRLARSLASLLVFAALPALAIDESDLLPVDQAFAVSAEATGPDAVRIRWKIADGYYLYRHRISVKPTVATVRSGALRLPGGEPHNDEFFGKTETYRQELVATLPGIAGAGATVSLKIKYQGCADLGICYPPQTRTLSVALPGAAATADTSGFNPLAPRTGLSGPPANPLGGVFGNAGKSGPLPEEQAFVFEAIAGDGNTLLLRFVPAPGYYLYRDRSRFALDADGIAPGKPGWPKGTTHHDEHFGDVVVYFDPVDVPLPLTRTKPDAQTVTLRATFQGCQNDGICYPPMTRSVRIALPRGEVTKAAVVDNAAIAAPATDTGDTATLAPTVPGVAAESDTPPAATDAPAVAAPAARELRVFGMKTNLLLAFLAALLGGLILNLMPCVLPVLSIKVLGLIESNDSRARARAHAHWYTAGVLVSFVALGAIVLALRNAGEALGWGFQMQRPGVVAVLGLVIFLFGLSLSGVWTLTGRWVGMGQTLASRSGASGDFFTGVLAVVVAAPCTAPMMFQALAWAFTASTASALLVFFGLGLGLAAPFLLIAYIPALARLLPKPGAWMDTFKQLLAFPLYFTAVWLLWVLAKQRGADAVALWAVSAVLLAFAAWAWTHAQMHGARWARFAAIIAMLVALWPVWSISKLPPLGAARAAARSADAVSVPFSEQRLADLRAAHRVVLVNMTADWCVTCKANEKAVFARDGFREALDASHAVYMVGDWTDVDPQITAYLRRYKAVGVPLYVLYPRSGGEGAVLPTVLTPTLMREALEQAASE